MIGKKINQLATELAPASTDLTIIGNPTTGVSKKITLAQLGAIFSGAVSFYTNYASFPATGTTDVIFCAKDTQKLYLWSGSAYVEVFPSQALLDTYQLRSEKGNANGYASLDSQGKVPISQLPSSIMEYKGTWSAATNTPTLANGTGDTGDVYICNAAGSVNFGAGAISFAVGDYVIYSGTIWQRSSGAVGTVTSVAATITGDSVTISGSPVTTSGTLAFAFAGTGAQYIKGDGTLATFPTTIDQAKNLITEVYNSTGATLTKGTVVYINGGQGNLPTVTKALASGDSTSAQTYGIVQADITNNNNGFVVVAGRLSDIDTQAYSVGTQLYLSSTTAGAYTSTKQYAPAHLVYVGIIVRSHPTQGIIEVKIQNGYELDELHNVAAQTPSNNDGLFWEASTSLWKNKSLSTILGGTPVFGSGTQNRLARWSSTSGELINSGIQDTGGSITNVLTTAGQYAWQFNGSTSTGLSYGALIVAGTNASDVSFKIMNASATSAYLYMWGDGRLQVNNIPNATTDTDTFLVSDSGVIKYRTGAELLSDIGAASASGYVPYTGATTNLNLGSNNLTAAAITGTSARITTLAGSVYADVNGNLGTTSGTQDTLTYWASQYSIASLSTSTYPSLTELSYVKGVTSSIQTQLNAKQNTLTNPVTGTGTTNYLPKFTGASTIGNSLVFDNGTNVGIGTASPGYLLDVAGASRSDYHILRSNQSAPTADAFIFRPADNTVAFGTANTERMRLDASGNLGLGVTPSAWGTAASTRAMQIGGAMTLFAQTNSGSQYSWVTANAYQNSGLAFEYITSTYASAYRQLDGSHAWLTAGSGTAGNAISFTQAMTLNASGNLSIGNTNNTYKLDVNGTARFNSGVTGGSIIFDAATNYGLIQDANSVSRIWFENTGSYRTLFDLPSAGTSFAFRTNSGTIIASITSSGAATFSSSVTVNGTIPATSGKLSVLTSTSTLGATQELGLLISNDGSTGKLAQIGFGYSESRSAAVIGGVISNGSGATTSDLFFATRSTTTGSDAPTERMRITSGGQVGIGTSSLNTADTLTVKTTTSGYNPLRAIGLTDGIVVQTTQTSGTSYFNYFIYNGSAVGSITSTGSSTAYNTSSDYRLKQDFKDYSGLDLVNKIKTYDYEWKADKTRSYGVIAHELQSVINYAVTGVKDGKEMQGVDYSKIVPVLIKAIQELNDKIK
jgi:hypothetical protein